MFLSISGPTRRSRRPPKHASYDVTSNWAFNCDNNREKHALKEIRRSSKLYLVPIDSAMRVVGRVQRHGMLHREAFVAGLKDLLNAAGIMVKQASLESMHAFMHIWKDVVCFKPSNQIYCHKIASCIVT